MKQLTQLTKAVVLATALVLTGCASTIRSNVTVFHELPVKMENKSFVFLREAAQENNLEHEHYEDQVRVALEQHGFTSARNAAAAALQVRMRLKQTSRDVTVVQPATVDPFWFPSPYYRHGYRHFGYYGGFMSPYWMDPYPYFPQYSRVTLFQRELNVNIARISDKKMLYDGTAVSEGRIGDLTKTAPYLIDSLFADFPGRSGVPRRVELKLEQQ